MKHLIFVLACLLSFSLFGQGWEQTYGFPNSNEIGWIVIQTTDSGFAILANSRYNAGSNVSNYLIKTDHLGIELWSVPISFNCQQIIATNDNGILIAFTQDSEWMLLKIDENGVNQWSQSYSLEGNSLVGSPTADGGFIITGRTGCGGMSCAGLLKISEDGVEQWSQTLDFDFQSPRSIQQTLDGGYICGGYSWVNDLPGNFSEFYEPSLIKTDINGNFQWRQEYGPLYAELNNSDFGSYEHQSWVTSVRQTIDGGYIFQVMLEAGGYEGFNWETTFALIKTNFLGIEEWRTVFTGETMFPDISVEFNEESNPAQFPFNMGLAGNLISSDGNYYFIGTLAIETINSHYGYLTRIDDAGNVIDIDTFPGITETTDLEELQGFVNHYLFWGDQTFDGGYILCGGKSNWGQDETGDVLLIKTTSEGTISSSFTIPTPSNRTLEKVVDALGREVNHTTNQILFHIYDDGSVEKKFIVD